MKRTSPIKRHTSLRRSTRPIRRSWPKKARTGRQPEALDTWRKQAKRGHEMWRLLIYAKEPSGICPMCLKRQWTDAAHIFPKGRYPNVRLDQDNGIPLCRACHRMFDTDHELHRTFALRYLGGNGYERLRLRAIGRGKTDMRLALMLLKQEIEARALGRRS